ncbi:MAG: permease [Candidatus Omnitrophota bacterium]
MIALFTDWLVYGLFKLDPKAQLPQFLNYFIYDSIKILLLLFVMILLIGVLRTFLPQERLKRWLTARGIMGNIMASVFGAVTPFCSCSSIPIFLSFLKAGVPLGVTFSFLITSPVINEYLVVLMLGTFGWKIALMYVVSGLSIGIFSGLVLGKMKLEKYLVADMYGADAGLAQVEEKYTFKTRLAFGWTEAVGIVQKLWLWVLVGVGIGAVIHNYVPESMIQGLLGKTGIFSVPIATLIGVPMYGSCAAIVPVAVVLFEKGIPLGTALSFMMAVSALSLPEAIMLRRAMKLPLIAMFFLITTVAIILTGYMFNMLQGVLV